MALQGSCQDMVGANSSWEEILRNPQKQMEVLEDWYQWEVMDLELRGFHTPVLFQKQSLKELHHRYAILHSQYQLKLI